MLISGLTANWATYALGSFWALNNVWGAGTLKNGVDYTQSIAIEDKAFPNGVKMSWSWPKGTSVLSYPEIVYGTQQGGMGSVPANVVMPSPTQLASFTNLSAQYSFSVAGQIKHFDVTFDLWLTSKPNSGILVELMVLVHDPWTPVPGQKNIGKLGNSRIYIAYNWGSGTQNWNLIQLRPAADELSGVVSFSDIFKTLIWDGVLTGSEYISGIELGAEVGGGTGTLAINSLSYQWKTNPPITGTAGNDAFKIAVGGGNSIVGNGGTDTVVYNGSYSEFQIKQTASKMLVMKNNDISTLDVFNGVTYVYFSDGIYDSATSSFTPATPGQH